MKTRILLVVAVVAVAVYVLLSPYANVLMDAARAFAVMVS